MRKMNGFVAILFILLTFVILLAVLIADCLNPRGSGDGASFSTGAQAVVSISPDGNPQRNSAPHRRLSRPQKSGAACSAALL